MATASKVKVYDFKEDQPWHTLNMRVISGILDKKAAIGLFYSHTNQHTLGIYLNRHKIGFVKKRVGKDIWAFCLKKHEHAVNQLLSMKGHTHYFPTKNVLKTLLEHESVKVNSLEEAQKLARAFYADKQVVLSSGSSEESVGKDEDAVLKLQ